MNTRKHLILSLVVSCTLLLTSFGQAVHAVERASDGQLPLPPPDPLHSFPLPPGQNVPLPAQTPAHAPGRLIVKLRGGTSNKAAATLRAELHATLAQELPLIGAQVWQIDAMSVEQAVAQYQDHPDVLYIEPDYIVHLPQPIAGTAHDLDLSPLAVNSVPNDPLYGDLWGMEMIDAPLAWDIQTVSTNVVVGVIDTGIDYTHPDLAANVWTNPNEIPDNGIDDDANGYVDDVHGWDFFNDDNDPMDDHGHGTHVAGTIAAVGNNGVGVTGVNWSGRVMALKFLGSDGGGTISGAVTAIEYATQMGVSLSSNSWGGGGYSQAVYDAIAAAGAEEQLFVAAAGNSNSDNDKFPSYPNSYDLQNIIAVAATDSTDQQAWFSSYGLASTDLGAPGVDILSTLPISSTGCGTGNDNGYGNCSGTSMAAPHVSGATALVWSRFSDAEWWEIKHRILASTDPLAALEFSTVSGGRLNVNGALTYVGGPLLTPRSLRIALGLGQHVTRTFTIDSLGVDSLDWSIDSGASWVQVTPISGTATSSHPTTVTLVIDSWGLPYGSTSAILTVTPDAPELNASRLSIVATLHYPLLNAPQTMLTMGNDRDNLGRKVALDGDVALAYNIIQGTVQTLRWNGTDWVPSGQLPANDPSGINKLAMAVSDDRVLVGDYETQVANVYRWDSASWVLEATLSPSDAPPDSYFGMSGDIDGDVAVVGALGIGAVYVYRWNGSAWIEEGKLMPDTSSFGFADNDRVAVSGDSIIVADWDADAAYVYHWDGTSWTQQAKLTASDGQPGDALGGVVSIYGDVAVASSSADAVYVYRRTGDQWQVEQRLTGNDNSIFFGSSVDVAHNLIAVGAPISPDPDGRYAGTTYVYQWNGYDWGGGKVFAQDRPPCTPIPGLPSDYQWICDWFGLSVALDEERVLVGSPAYDEEAGAALLYDLTDLAVQDAPSLRLSKDNFAIYLAHGASVTHTLYVENVGTGTLDWSLSPRDNVDWLDTSSISGTLLSDEGQMVELVFGDPGQTVLLQTSLIVLSNDPFRRHVELPISLRVGWNYSAYLPLIVR